MRQIAAGEVVDRPASALKELVENALDAGARAIQVELSGGGADRIQVSDDGMGMTPADMRLAIERHTTSKLAREEDLQHVRTLGFRGEALAAICAVSRAQFVSRPAGGEAGHRLAVEGGCVISDEPAARAVGTTVELKELFFNVPARRKFLQAPVSEARHALGALRRLVLARPDVHYTVSSEGRRVLAAPPARDPGGRVGQLYGSEFSEQLLQVELEEEGLALTALLGPPELVRGTRTDQHLLLSGRPVRPGALGAAVYNAYRPYLARGRHPVFFLYIEVDPELVDVNVHPRKEEVRFRAERAVSDLVRRAAVRALGGAPSVRHPVHTGDRWQVADAVRASAPTPQASLVADERQSEEWRLLGQIKKGYLVVETSEGLEVVDQHAAHERVLYEAFDEGEEVVAQAFLVPVQIDVPFDQVEALEQAIPDLARLGVVLEPFGMGALLLRAWPAALAERQAALGFRDPLLAAAELYRSRGERPLRELWRRVACGAAVKAGEVLTAAEQAALVRRWKAAREPARCPHGRPVAVTLTWRDLDRAVGR